MPRVAKPQAPDIQVIALLQQVLAAIGLLRDVPADIRHVQAEIHIMQLEITKLKQSTDQSKSTHL